MLKSKSPNAKHSDIISAILSNLALDIQSEEDEVPDEYFDSLIYEEIANRCEGYDIFFEEDMYNPSNYYISDELVNSDIMKTLLKQDLEYIDLKTSFPEYHI